VRDAGSPLMQTCEDEVARTETAKTCEFYMRGAVQICIRPPAPAPDNVNADCHSPYA